MQNALDLMRFTTCRIKCNEMKPVFIKYNALFTTLIESNAECITSNADIQPYGAFSSKMACLSITSKMSAPSSWSHGV